MRAPPLFRPSNRSLRLALIAQSKSSDLSFFTDEAVSERNPDLRVSGCKTSSPLQSPCLAAPRWAGLLTYSFPPQISSPTTLLYRHVRPGSIPLQRQAPTADNVRESRSYLRRGGPVSARR